METNGLTNTRRYRTAVAAFLAGLAVGILARAPEQPAYAQIPDPAQQRVDMNAGITQLNAQATEILNLLRTGTLKVRVIETDKTSGVGQRISFEPSGNADPHPQPGASRPGAPSIRSPQ